MLTISTRRLGDLFMPMERRLGESVAYLKKRLRSMHPESAGYWPLIVAVRCVEDEWFRTVEIIRDRGGLLLIGGRA